MERGLCTYVFVLLSMLILADRGIFVMKYAVEGTPDDYQSPTQPPAVFIFGDSTVDVGTNNHLKDCGTKADSPYYGIDFEFSRPTGRFTNGHNIADFIVRYLGGYKRSPPPFLSLINRMSSFKSAILRGANFASGGSGIFDETGNITYKEVVPLRKQVQQFATVCANITEVLGKAKADELISKSIYIISVGSNDIFEYSEKPTALPDIFMANLIEAYTIQIEELYNLGARKFAVLSVGAIGCVPKLRALDDGSCVDQVNQLAQAFYAVVSSLLQQFSSQYQGFSYSLGNLYNVIMSTILNFIVEGLKDVQTPCCGTANTTCQLGVDLCPNRNEYLFWDMYHPTQVASDRAARVLLFSEAADFVTPINISSLAAKP